VPTAPKVRALNRRHDGAQGARAHRARRPLGLFDLEAGSDRIQHRFRVPEALSAIVRAARETGLGSARAIYARFLPLIVFEQQPGVAVRKEILRPAGLLATATGPHPGGGLPPGGRAATRPG